MDGLKARLSFDAVAYDYDDEYLTIDTDTHTININNVSRLFGVQYDGNSKLIKFKIRNKLSDIQKMQDSIVYINWIDSRGVKGQSIAINKTINNDTCEFAWKVPFDALKNSGVLHFAMSAVVTKNSSSVIDQRWSTQIASVITPDGIYIKSYTPSSEEEDRIAQIYNELSNMINKQNDNLQSQVNSLKEDLNYVDTIADMEHLYSLMRVSGGSLNIMNPDAFESGYINFATGEVTSNEAYNHSGYVRVRRNKVYGTYSVNLAHFAFYDRFFNYYPNATNNLSTFGGTRNNWNYFIAPIDGYIRCTLVNPTKAMIIDVDSISDLDNYTANDSNYIAYAPKAYKSLASVNSITNRWKLVGNNVNLEVGRNSIKKNKSLSFFGTLNGDYGGLIVGHGFGFHNGNIAEITATALRVFSYDGKVQNMVVNVPHRLTISTFIAINIKVSNNGLAKITIQTLAGTFTKENVVWTGSNGYIVANTSRSEFTDASVGWTCEDYSKPIWVFGDSYVTHTYNQRWTYWLIQELKYDHCLLNGFSGEKSAEALADFKNALTHGTPQYALWCVGMNDGDSTSGISSSYKSATDEFLSLCDRCRIVPILATIPNVAVSGFGNSYKNAWVKASKYRYIDFNEAVGGDVSTEWYSGLLSSDGVHPTEIGAKVLCQKALSDCPELMGL